MEVRDVSGNTYCCRPCVTALVLELTTPKSQTITNSKILWRYEGIRAIFAKMASPKDEFRLGCTIKAIQRGVEIIDISSKITFELQ